MRGCCELVTGKVACELAGHKCQKLICAKSQASYWPTNKLPTFGPVLLITTIFRHENCFLESVATDGRDGHRLKLETNNYIQLYYVPPWTFR